MIRDAMLNRAEAEWEALEDAIGTINGFEPGHVLTADEVAGLRLMDRCHREDEETATDAYHRGYEEGLRERGGDELVAREKWISEREIRAATDRAMRLFAEARAEAAEAQLTALTAHTRRMQEIVDLARELVSPAGMVNRGVDRGLVVVEKADKSDPHYRLCTALDALSSPLPTEEVK